ncbi:hypothetical protein BMS3Abin17_00011 [archaeon BMS3Abin17]|nr:hypothetical protein BMS3Abin17_00011 [archaeon BMS3Abin17]
MKLKEIGMGFGLEDKIRAIQDNLGKEVIIYEDGKEERWFHGKLLEDGLEDKYNRYTISIEDTKRKRKLHYGDLCFILEIKK